MLPRAVRLVVLVAITITNYLTPAAADLLVKRGCARWSVKAPKTTNESSFVRRYSRLPLYYGWQVLGLQPDGLVSTSPTADRMLTIAIGHGAFIRTDTTITSFTAALGLPSSAANRLAKTLVIHQATAAAKIRLTANNLRCNPPTARSG